jgi:hypothetical protein
MSTRGCRCDPCQVERSKCGKCLPCVPKYRCIKGTYTPPPYDDTKCPYRFADRLYWDCSVSEWVAQAIDRHRELIIPSVSVSVVESDYPETCGYNVSTPVGVYFFDQNDPMELSYEDEDGGTWDIEITGAGMITNPLISCGCSSPCYCATCLPSSLCAFFDSGICLGGASGSGSLTWDGTKWTGQVGEYVIDVELAECSEGCLARVTVEGPDGTGTGGWALESSQTAECDPPFRSYECKESEATTMRKGGSDGCMGKRRVSTWLSTDISIRDSYDNVIGTLYLEDTPCGEVCEMLPSIGCNGSCTDLDTPSASCAAPVLTATIYSDSCDFTYNMGIPQRVTGGPTISDQCNWVTPHDGCQEYVTYDDFPGTVVLGNGYGLVLLLYYIATPCSDGTLHPENYRLRWSIHRPCFAEPGYPACITGDVEVNTGATCAPLELEFNLGITWAELRSSAPHCAYEPVPCDSEDEEIKVRITR